MQFTERLVDHYESTIVRANVNRIRRLVDQGGQDRRRSRWLRVRGWPGRLGTSGGQFAGNCRSRRRWCIAGDRIFDQVDFGLDAF